MKVGFRKPSPKRSIKARTTGKVKRKMKRAVNPIYGKKGMGLVNDPKKAAYNAAYIGSHSARPTSPIGSRSRRSKSAAGCIGCCSGGGSS